jgi:hypothetical protein
VFMKELSVECLTKYGNVGKLIELGKYYEKVQSKRTDFTTGDADDDNLLYHEALKGWVRVKLDMELKHPMLYGMIWLYLSLESIDEIKNQAAFKVCSVDKDPEGLWQTIVTTHRINCISHIPVVIKQAAWDRYTKCRQGAFESLITYRENFDAALKAYTHQGNAVLESEDTVMHFFMGLDAARYAHMKTMVHNNMTIGAQQPPKTVNEVYTIAANWIRTQAVHRPGQNTRCHKCKVLGHYANKCPLLATKQEGVMLVAHRDDDDNLFQMPHRGNM